MTEEKNSLNTESWCGDMFCNAARQAIESTYKGECSVFEIQYAKNEITFLEEKKTVCTVEEQPCRLSFSSIQSVSDGDVAQTAQSVKLFIAPEIEIKAGSKLTITQDGITNNYKRSGLPAVYSTHQEIMLEPYKERA